MTAFKARAEEVAAREINEVITPAEAAQLTDELRALVRGSFRPTLIPHPLMRIHGRICLEMAKPMVDSVLGGIGYGACITGGADNQVALARLCVDTGGVYSAHDVQSGYPMGQLQDDFPEVVESMPVLARAFLIHFGRGATLYDSAGVICNTCNGYAQGGTLDALCFQLGMKRRLQMAARAANQQRGPNRARAPQAVPASYIDDTGILAPEMATWCEYYRHVRDGFDVRDNQIICTALTRQQIVQCMIDNGVQPDDFPVIVGRQDDPNAAAGIKVLGVPVGTEEYIRQHANARAGDADERDATASGAREKVRTLKRLDGNTQVRLQLLRHCASTQCLHLARAMPANLYCNTTRRLDSDIDGELWDICGVPAESAPPPRRNVAPPAAPWQEALRRCHRGGTAFRALAQARSPMAMGGLGVLKLDRRRAAVAGMCAAAGSLARMGQWLRQLRGWDLERNAQLPMGGYAWARNLVVNALRPPDHVGDGSADGMQREMILQGWAEVERLRAERVALAPVAARRFTKLITRTVYRSRYGTSGMLRRETTLPTNYLDMITRAAKPGLQNDVVTHSYALELCERIAQARIEHNHKFVDRLDALREPGSTALLCAMPSMDMFTVHGRAFSFAMRCRLGLPALIGTQPGADADEYARKQSAMNGRHDAAAQALLRVCSLSDRIVSSEPKRRYQCHRGTDCPVTPDGAVLGLDGAHDTFDVSFAPTLHDAKRRAIIKRWGYGSPQRRDEWAAVNRVRRRQARLDCAAGRIDRQQLAVALQRCAGNDQDAYHPGYTGPCAIAGDRFHPIILTPYGGWWRWSDRGEHNDFLINASHSGDDTPDYDIEAPRFDHHARTWASWTHTAFTRQAVACATATASYGGAIYSAHAELRRASNGDHQRIDLRAQHLEPIITPPEPASAA